MPYRFVQVDVFTRQKFGGNQLAVFTDARGMPVADMQAVAREMNFFESTFVLPPEEPSADARVRIFTPSVELPFAGHPTVGTAFVLGAERGKRELRLQLGVGTLRVEADPANVVTGFARMEQPVPGFRPIQAPAALLAGLVGLESTDIARSPQAEFGSAGLEFLYLPLRTLDAGRRACGDPGAMQRFFSGSGHPAIYLFTTETESAAAAHARMFSLSLGSGVREDPATGSAAGPAGAYLVRHGASPAGRLVIEQGHEMQRPSEIEVEVKVDHGVVSSVQVGGGVVRIAEGQLLV